jgi:hypothetical protein
MPTIDQLVVLTQLQASDQLAVWSTDNGDTRSATIAVLTAFLSQNFQSLVVQDYIQTQPVTVANLPSASEAGAGATAFVTDANSTTFNAVVAGGGSSNVPVTSDGSAWRIG